MFSAIFMLSLNVYNFGLNKILYSPFYNAQVGRNSNTYIFYYFRIYKYRQNDVKLKKKKG